MPFTPEEISTIANAMQSSTHNLGSGPYLFSDLLWRIDGSLPERDDFFLIAWTDWSSGSPCRLTGEAHFTTPPLGQEAPVWLTLTNQTIHFVDAWAEMPKHPNGF